jgi:2-hydroxymuconate-semialdehyde hydrolase
MSSMTTEIWEFEGHQIKMYKTGTGPALLLLHGVGPGTSIPANFSAVIGPLSEHFTIYGMDLIGFGGSSRKTAMPFFDFPLWVRQTQHVAEAIVRLSQTEGVVEASSLRVFGHSIGAALALRLAGEVSFVKAIVATGPAGGEQTLNDVLDRFWTFPETPDALRTAMLGSMFDTSGVTDTLVQERFATLQNGGIGPYFAEMMSADKQAMLDSARLSAAQLTAVQAPVLLIHGAHDLPCPWDGSARTLMLGLPNADLWVVGRCGHNPAREYTAKVLNRIVEHFA